MSLSRAALFCAGRGSYTEKSLGSLAAPHRFIDEADALRRELGLVPLRELDAAARFDSALHLDPVHVSALIYVITQIDAERARRQHELVACGGNSMGWYSALAVADSLSFADGFRLAQTMALLQKQQQEEHGGGQVLYPLVDDAWRASEDCARAVEHALASSEGRLFRSIELGSYAVLAGTEEGIRHALATLPKLKLGGTPYPFRLLQHGAYHTPLLEGVSQAARAELARLEFRAPRIPLVDGRGARHTPWSADPAALRDYTFGAQVTTPYDFARGVRVALREYAPDELVLPGPGNTLGGICGRALVAEGWRGMRTKADFERVQAGARPCVISMRR